MNIEHERSTYKILYIEREAKAPLLSISYYMHCALMTNDENRLLAFLNTCSFLYAQFKQKEPNEEGRISEVNFGEILIGYADFTTAKMFRMLRRVDKKFSEDSSDSKVILWKILLYICLSRIYKTGLLLIKVAYSKSIYIKLFLSQTP